MGQEGTGKKNEGRGTIVLCSLSSGHISRKNTVGERKERKESEVVDCSCGLWLWVE